MFWSEKDRRNLIRGAFATTREDLLATSLKMVLFAANEFCDDKRPTLRLPEILSLAGKAT
jgi:hypothetical protein